MPITALQHISQSLCKSPRFGCLKKHWANANSWYTIAHLMIWTLLFHSKHNIFLHLNQAWETVSQTALSVLGHFADRQLADRHFAHRTFRRQKFRRQTFHRRIFHRQPGHFADRTFRRQTFRRQRLFQLRFDQNRNLYVGNAFSILILGMYLVRFEIWEFFVLTLK